MVSASQHGQKKINVWVPIQSLTIIFYSYGPSRSVLNQRSLARCYQNLIKYQILISSDRDTVYKNFIKHQIFISDRDAPVLKKKIIVWVPIQSLTIIFSHQSKSGALNNYFFKYWPPAKI